MQDKVLIVYKTDAWHSYNSRNLIGICLSIESAIVVCEAQADKEEGEIGEDQLFNLRNIHQTQGYFGDGEFQIEIVELNTLL